MMCSPVSSQATPSLGSMFYEFLVHIDAYVVANY
jgi:hypothetical protein